MAEKLIRSADASCYICQDGDWVCLDGGLSTVWLFKANDSCSARIVAKSTSDQKYVINSALGPGCGCSMVSANFVQWDSAGVIWGLNFADQDNASHFCKRVIQVVDAVTAAIAAKPAEAKPSIPDAPPAPVVEPVPEKAAPEKVAVAASVAPSGPVLEVPPSLVTKEVAKAGPIKQAAPAPIKVAEKKEEQLAPEPVKTGSRRSQSASEDGPKSVIAPVAVAPVSAAAVISPAVASGLAASSPAGLENPELSRISNSEAISGSPKLQRGRFGTSNNIQPKGLTTGRKNTDPTLGKLQRGSGSESPSTLRFSIGKKKDAWRDTVDMTTPRSMVIQNIEESGPNPQCLMQKDVTALSTRERVIKELFTTELSYCKSLQQIVKVVIPLCSQHKPFKPEQQAVVFGNIEFVYAVNSTLLGKLNTALSDWDDSKTSVGDVMLGAIKFFKPYGQYLAEYSTGLKLLEELTEKKKTVQLYASACQEECGGLTIASLLVTPVQRIPRYILLLQEIIKHTPQTHPDLKNLTDALVAVKKYADDMNKTVKLSENKKEFTRLAGIIEGLGAIKSPLLFSDEKMKISTEGQVYNWMILFSDRLVFILDNKIAQELLLHSIWVKNIQSKASDLVFSLQTPDANFLLESEIPQNKKVWLERLETAIAEELAERDYADNESEDRFSRRFAFKWILPQNQVSIYQGQWKDAVPNGTGKFKYATKASYEGAFVKGKRHGQGKMVYLTGETLDGGWEDDLPHGKGKFTSPGSEYDGDFVKGEFSGSGTLKQCDGSVYVGEFCRGVFHGHGELKDVAGGVYSGEWKDGLRHGNGKLSNSVGTYEGGWRGDRQNGDGKMEYSNGILYQGGFVDGLASGSGKMTFPGGAVYIGQFLNGVFDGPGTLTEAQGKKSYQGQFSEGRRHGKGVQKYESGSVYDGEWQGGRRHGYGKFTSQTVCFDGNWETDVFHGRGKLIDVASGRVLYDGHWKSGRRDGKGYSTYSDGTKYTGGFFNDLREGMGVMENATVGWKFGGDWSKGRRHGNGELTIGNYKFTGEWQNDRRNGQGKERFNDVHTSFDGEFVNDRRVRGKISVEAPGKTPLHVEIDYEKEKEINYIVKLPPPVVGIQLCLFESDFTPELEK